MIYNEDYYDIELIRYLKEKVNKDKTEIDFLNKKIGFYKKLVDGYEVMSENDIKMKVTHENKDFVSDKDFWKKESKYLFEKEKKEIEEKINRNNSYVFYYKTKLARIPKPIEDIIDLGDLKEKEKIIILEMLGVIAYLREKEPFMASTNALASIISGFTGMNPRTVQSYINPINNPEADQKNNPLKSIKTVNKVIQKLSSLGFKQSKNTI